MISSEVDAAASAPLAAPRPVADRLKRWAAIASVSVAGVLISAKAGAWLATGSVSLLSTLIDSLLDLAASLINLLAIHHASQPPDQEHRFGHGKAEPLAGLGQAAFIGGSAAFLLFEAGARLVRPRPIDNEDIGLAVMALSIVLTLVLVLYQRWVIRRTQSLAISADSLHYKTDLLVNLGVVAALVLSSRFDLPLADPVIAIAIAVYILWSAWTIFTDSLHMLMDRELSAEARQRIRDIALAHPAVISIHDLRTRSSGSQSFIQFHLELDGNSTLRAAHAVADEVMERVEREFPNAEVLIHEDPHGINERRSLILD